MTEPNGKARLLLLLILIISACRDEEIVRVRVPKEAATIVGLRWTLPKDWKELPASGMRRATLLPPGTGKAEVTVIALPGEVGGELANVNRWRGQIGLTAIEETTLVAERSTVVSPAGSVALYDFTSGGAKKTRLVAGTIAAGGMTLFIKLMGDADAVAGARPAFLSLLESLHAPR